MIARQHPRIAFIVHTSLVLLILYTPCGSQEWKLPDIVITRERSRPLIACTAAELQRLRAAYEGSGASHRVVAAVIARADRALGQKISFPPRGGQHNQWYQCDTCQLALRTIDDTHHQCRRCKKVYSGEPYDDVIYSRKHDQNLSNMTAAAWAHAITGETKYAAHARQVLLGYARRYSDYPYHSASRTTTGWGKKSGGHLFEQTLTEASSFTRSIAPSYDLIHDSPALSPADHESIRAGLLEPMLKNIDKNKAGKSNWQTWHNAAMLLGGAVIEDESWIRKAIADPGNGFVRQMEISVSAEGMWYENSWGYHFYTLAAMVEIVEGARRLGIDLWSHPVLQKMFLLPVEYAMPNGALPRFGDDVNTTINSAIHYLEYLYHERRDPALLPYLSGTPTWTSVMFGREPAKISDSTPLSSTVFRGAGHAILRTGGAGELAAVLTFGPYGGFHGHYDKLSFVFFGRKKELGVDPGRARSQAYRLPIHRNWYKATLSHNTVLVDTRSQQPAAGKLLLFTANASYAAVAASCDRAYDGVTHRRLLCMTPTYLLIFDDLNAATDRRFDWVYHNRGEQVLCSVATESDTLGKSYPGQEYVDTIKSGLSDEPLRARFLGNDVTTHIIMAPQRGTIVRTGTGVGASVEDRVPMIMVTRKGPGARFVTALEPVAKDAAPGVTSVSITDVAGTASITVRRKNATDIVRLTQDHTLTVTVKGQSVLEGRGE